MKWLVTGFEPFGGDAVNSSWELARRLQGKLLNSEAVVEAVCLPCAFAQSLPALEAAIQAHQPQAVLAIGQAASRAVLSYERVAVNWIDARIPDNLGAQPLDEPVLAGAPAAYFTRLPVKAMAAAAAAAGVRAEVSFSAGSFVCNQVFFGLQHRLRRRKVRGGFLHVPALGAAMDLEQMLLGVQAGLRVASEAENDLRLRGGLLD